MIDFNNNMFIFGRYETLNIRIKKNATNGDMIKALFPYISRTEKDGLDIEVYDLDLTEIPVVFDLEWWNAPYKVFELKGENK